MKLMGSRTTAVPRSTAAVPRNSLSRDSSQVPALARAKEKLPSKMGSIVYGTSQCLSHV